MYDELSIFKDKLKEGNYDILIFGGDYFDKKLSMIDMAAYYAMTFFNEILTICKSTHTAIRMVLGTKTHELNQLQVFKTHEHDLDIDFRVIETAQVEDFKGHKFLYIPEEYPTDPESYYAEFKKGKYSAIFSHATWDTLANGLGTLLAATGSERAPVFIEKEWLPTIENGFVISGHIHKRDISPDKKVIYPGAYTMWGFGDVSERGFAEFEFTEDGKYNVEIINNTKCPAYETIKLDSLGINLDESDVQQIQKALDSQISTSDNFRINLAGISKEKIDILKKYYDDKPNVKVVVIEGKKSLKESVEVINKEQLDKYKYIIKHELPINEMIQRFCKEEYSIDIPITTVDEIIKK